MNNIRGILCFSFLDINIVCERVPTFLTSARSVFPIEIKTTRVSASALIRWVKSTCEIPRELDKEPYDT